MSNPLARGKNKKESDRTGKPANKAARKKAPAKAAKNTVKPGVKRGRNGRRGLRKLFLVGIAAAIAICLLPVGLTLLYKWQAIHPVSTLMVYEWVRGNKVDRRWVDLDNISPNVWQSVVSSEDGQFCSHDGVDWTAINTVIDDALEGEKVRGASTIAMQSVKNLYLWSSRSYVRKGLEVPLALLVDAVWDKKRVMEIYLNIAEWGPGIYGIEAAAQHHFKRSAAKLSRRQAALLTVTLPNPILRDPRKPNKGMRRLARLVEGRAKQSGAYVRCLQ